MLVYRDGRRVADTAAELRRVQRLCGAGNDLERLLIECTEFESAVVDALAPQEDTWDERLQRLRAASCEAARAWLTWRDGGVADRDALAACLAALEAVPLPHRITLKVSEGYAFYAVFPDTYASSARQFVDDVHPPRVCLLGIRGIGCSLSAVAAAAIERQGCPTTTVTVRPRGHPFARELRIDSRLRSVLRAEAAAGASFAIVDEGPGLSGSSFTSVAHALRALDIEPHRTAFLSSWDPPPERLRSEDARRAWRTHRRYWTDAASGGLAPERLFSIAGATHDWSAGRWRPDVLGDSRRWPAVRPDDERWKIAVPGERVIKFVGLGPYGLAARSRAERLHALGLGARPGELRRGFLELEFVSGRPLDHSIEYREAAQIGAYIGEVARAFPTAEGPDTDTLALMIETNVRELNGYGGLAFAADVRARANTLAALPAAEIDARILPHEWIRTGAGLVKVDALDHHRDHFFPGVQSAAWDLAAAIVEFDLDDRCVFALVRAFERASQDAAAARHLPFYQLAYSAFRAGYLTLAAETAAGDESPRLRQGARRYAARLPGSTGATPSAP